MKSLLEQWRGARHIVLLISVILLALVALLATGGARRQPEAAEGSALERRLERVLSGIDGAKGVRVMITEDGEGGVLGAVIVTDDALDVRALLDIQTAVETLLDVDAARVSVIARSGRRRGEIE